MCNGRELELLIGEIFQVYGVLVKDNNFINESNQ